MPNNEHIDAFIAEWAATGGSELANTQSFVNGLCALIGVDPPRGSQTDDAANDYVFERRVFQDNGDGTTSFGRLDAYKKGCFVLEAKQGSDADRADAAAGKADFFGKPAADRVKQGTARRGTPGWASAMFKAKGQAERYAKALPVEHGWPPFLIVTDVGHCIDVYADFSGTGKQYTQFPDAARFRIMLDDLRDAEVRARLAQIWTDPLSLDPSKEAARVTRLIAGNLADLSKRLEKREQNPTCVADFLMRCLFTMFAEDVGLIPKESFTRLLQKLAARPDNFVPQLTALWRAMDTGGFVGALGEAGEPVRRFNGYLFKDTSALALEADEIALLIAAASHRWNDVEPAIFGTLLERALDGKERAKLGAHYTPRAYVERLVMPTVIEPLRADWTGVQASAAARIDEGKIDEARAMVETFHGQLAQTKVLDPACGTGNFLYVAMARMKELEGEVVGLLTELGDDQYVAELSGHTITPENFLGIEINPRAAAIAQLVLWIGYLQWHFRVNGEGRMPPEPVLRDVKTIENRDALIEWDERVLERDDHGKLLTRWDGETMKVHPVTGKKVPDEDARVEVWRYVNPKAAKWPKADFIVGNPPFIGNKRMRLRLGDGYVRAVRKARPKVPANVDFVMYWWDQAATVTREKRSRRFGLVSTNSIKQITNRKVVNEHKAAAKPLSLAFAIPDHPWRDVETDAAVRVAMTVGTAGRAIGTFQSVISERRQPDGNAAIQFSDRRAIINADLTIGSDTSVALGLQSNRRLSFMGIIPVGMGFRVEEARHSAIFAELDGTLFIRRYLGGSDLTDNVAPSWIIDIGALDEAELRSRYPATYQYLWDEVRPHRLAAERENHRQFWWRFGESRVDMRVAFADLSRFIATTETAKFRIFSFLDTDILPDQKLRVIALADDYDLGILSSSAHLIWAAATGGRQGVGNDLIYNHTTCFDKFPFPADVPEPLKDRVRAEAEALDALRKRVLADHDDLTLTGLYNVLEALWAGRLLTDKERDIHDRGLVTIIRQHHDTIDALVAEAYGWPADLNDEEILTLLVALNRERAAEESKGLVRWLRPEFQAPHETRVATNADLDLGDTAPAPVSATIIPWPRSLPEQVSAVAALLAAAPAPQHPRDIARAFDGKRAASVTPVLDALTAIGQARRLADGRYAA